ncbi:MAG TPA: hypothetical protein VHK24_13800 [Steroidobacter sp.]|nr:hypothetical protein [Steroidobacter sp.]
MVVHEWGTFTSIAGEDGRAVQWLPQSGPTDLPDFVGRIDCRLKGSLSGTVRMETPVIYFYSPRETTVNVNVRFRQGVITEWFPRPGGASGSTINDAFRGDIAWTNVKVMPGARAQFPVEPKPHHYYAARETDAAPLRVGSEQERFLFYRGIGRIPPPITARLTPDGQIMVGHTHGAALGDIILFESRDGAMTYRAWHTSAARVAFNPLELEGEGASPQAQLQKMLVAHGLYPREAQAMVESWRDSWFEQGTRLFYIVSNEAIDTILPLQVDPQPDQIARVFVGRLEIATPATLRGVKTALEQNDRVKLAQYGRFLDPIGRQLMGSLPEAERPAMGRRLQLAYSSLAPAASTCRSGAYW